MIARYGEVRSRAKASVLDGQHGRTLTIGETLVFDVDDWKINAVVIDGRCAQITYGKSGGWSEEQLRHLLNTHGGRDRWREEKPPSKDAALKTNRRWKRDDGLVASWSGAFAPVNGAGFQITSAAYERAVERAKSAQKSEDRKLPKF